MLPHRSLAALAATLLLSLSGLTACGGDSDDGESGGASTGSDATGAEPAGDTPPDGEGEGGGDEPAESGAGGFADCSAISADEMAPVLGTGTGTAEVPPGGMGCNYALDDPRMPSVFLEEFATSDFGDGFEGARANIANTAVGPLEGTPETVSAGDDAELVVGPSVMGGESLQSIGLVLLGDTIVRATVIQASELDAATMTQLTTDVLTLIASKA